MWFCLEFWKERLCGPEVRSSVPINLNGKPFLNGVDCLITDLKLFLRPVLVLLFIWNLYHGHDVTLEETYFWVVFFLKLPSGEL
jgi:hypothetical protein